MFFASAIGVAIIATVGYTFHYSEMMKNIMAGFFLIVLWVPQFYYFHKLNKEE